MPNWFINDLALRGDPARIAAFKQAHIKIGTYGDDVDTCLDFESVIPRPEILEGTRAGSGVDEGLIAIGREDLICKRAFATPDETISRAMQRAGADTLEELRRIIRDKHPDYVAMAEKSVAAYEATGSLDWYEWCCENWGTKWNSQRLHSEESSPDVLHLNFRTAWAPPIPVIRRLLEMWPDLKLEHYWGCDEGEYTACSMT
jgi:hypothetical protein